MSTKIRSFKHGPYFFSGAEGGGGGGGGGIYRGTLRYMQYIYHYTCIARAVALVTYGFWRASVR